MRDIRMVLATFDGAPWEAIASKENPCLYNAEQNNMAVICRTVQPAGECGRLYLRQCTSASLDVHHALQQHELGRMPRARLQGPQWTAG